MMRPGRRAAAQTILLVCLVAAMLTGCRRATPAAVAPNDNRSPSGVLRDGVLSLRLEVRNGLWRPDGATGIGLVAPMFAEERQAPQDPGPLIRVASGTRVVVHLRNTLPSATVTIHGLHTHPSLKDDPVVLRPGAARDVMFDAGLPGTYFYWGSATGGRLDDRNGYDGQLNGAFIVDPAGQDPRRASERVFVISHWSQEHDPHPTIARHDIEAWVINGQSWPATERLTYPVSRAITWRLINASYEGHPMHLHGTYYRIERTGTQLSDKTLTREEQPVVATNVIDSGQTQTLTWTPGQPGNWLFHCHILFHVDPQLRIVAEPPGHAAHSSGTPAEHMAGLVIGIQVQPSPAGTAPDRSGRERSLTLQVGERPGLRFPSPDTPSVTWPGLGYRLVDPGHPANAAVFSSPGPTLVLTRGEPVAIAVENRLSAATTVHWHGIELESYYDGVSGYGGLGRQITPAILPGATFVARFTPPRAGTFMYHTHLNDYEQLSTGLYGAIVVIDPKQTFDPAVDKVFVLSRGGPDDEKDPVLINGTARPPAEDLKAHLTYRFRFVGITPAPLVTLSLRDGDATAQWRPLAKDGATLEGTRPLVPATLKVAPGETYDFAFTPAVAGSLRLTATLSETIRAELALRVK